MASRNPFQVGKPQASGVLNFARAYRVKIANQQRDPAAPRVGNGGGQHLGSVGSSIEFSGHLEVKGTA